MASAPDGKRDVSSMKKQRIGCAPGPSGISGVFQSGTRSTPLRNALN